MGAYKADEESGNTYVLCKRIRRTPSYSLICVRYVSDGCCFRNKEEQHAAGIGHFGLMVIQRTSFHYASAGDYSLDDLAFPLAIQPNSKMS